MSAFLSRMLAAINGLIALVIILLTALMFVGFEFQRWKMSGGVGEPDSEAIVTMLVLGVIVGVFNAAVICGLVATVVVIRSELTRIRKLLEADRNPAGVAVKTPARIEPQAPWNGPGRT
jgi:hypothetical protein